jgi:hypothetical protein
MTLEELTKLRREALDHAVRLATAYGVMPSALMVLEMASDFEQFLLGKDKQ